MFRKFIDNYLKIKNENVKRPDYKEAGLISSIISLSFVALWILIIILTFSLDNGLVHGLILIINFVFSFVINPIMLIFTILFLILQWKITINKFTILALISNILLLSTIIISIII